MVSTCTRARPYRSPRTWQPGRGDDECPVGRLVDQLRLVRGKEAQKRRGADHAQRHHEQAHPDARDRCQYHEAARGRELFGTFEIGDAPLVDVVEERKKVGQPLCHTPQGGVPHKQKQVLARDQSVNKCWNQGDDGDRNDEDDDEEQALLDWFGL